MRVTAWLSSMRQLSRTAARSGVACGGAVVNTMSMPGLLLGRLAFSAGLGCRLVCRGDVPLGFVFAEIARPAIPEGGLIRIAREAMYPGAVEKSRIEGQRHAHSRTRVA